MPRVLFRLHGRLQDFLPRHRRGRPVVCAFRGPQTVKHLLEGLDVPHPEVGWVQQNGRRVNLNTIPQDGDVLEVFPWLDGSLPLEGPPRFALDGHLGRLAAYLRMLGVDTWYAREVEDADLVNLAVAEGRIILTRDRDLLKRKAVRYGYWLRALTPREQLYEVVQRFALQRVAQPFHRCLACNAPLEPVSKAAVWAQLEPLTRRYYDEFHRCPACGRVYWKGSHYERMARLVEEVLGPDGVQEEG